MNNQKTGDLIRNARKEKGLTQNNIATHLGITDRAVSKWERGICAPDIALLEPLGELLDLSVVELISGERRRESTPSEPLEAAVRETISYSQNELTTKRNAANKKLCAAITIAILLSIAICLGFLWYKGFFHIIGRFPSPDGSTVTTVYSCKLGYRDPPDAGGFTLSDKGHFNGRTIYEGSEFRGLWWSPTGCYQVVSMLSDGEIFLSLADFTRNIGVNLTHRLKSALYDNAFFADVPYNEDDWRDISFAFIQWSVADPEKMLIYFSYTDATKAFQEGYMWFDYESGDISGEMKLENGEKETDFLNHLIP